MLREDESSRLWWCNSGEKQSRHYLSFRCQTWRAQSEKMWRRVGKACGLIHPRAPSVRTLFQNDKATPAVLTSLRGTQVGRMAELTSLEEEGNAEEIMLRPQEGEGGWDGLAGKEEAGPGPPWEFFFPFAFLFALPFFCSLFCSVFSADRGSPPLTAGGRVVSRWIVGRGWDFGNTCKKPTAAASAAG